MKYRIWCLLFATILPIGICMLSCHAQEQEDLLIVPGKRIGVVQLGMKPTEVKEKMGNYDAAYTLPKGVRVERAEWKESDKLTYGIKVFYDSRGRVIQVSEDAPRPVTADGITINSSVDDVKRKYPNVSRLRRHAKDWSTEVWDDVKNGITFHFIWSDVDDESQKHLYVISIHEPGKHVIPDCSRW